MMTVNEVSKLTHVSVRALHHYDAIGLLKPTAVTEAGYRLYDEQALQRLYLILVFRELGFPLRRIGSLLEAPEQERNELLEQQLALLRQRVTYLQNRIHLARGIKQIGVEHMNWQEFRPEAIDDYSAQAKALYGSTDAYREYTVKSSKRGKAQEDALGQQVMDFFRRLGQLRDQDPGSEAVQTWVAGLRGFFTEHYYNCTPQILLGLGEMYAGGGSMTENIDAAGGPGTGEFARQAIRIYCAKK